jgi:hypothetical protein
MTHFVGLDVSQKMTAICVVDNFSFKDFSICSPDTIPPAP